MSLVPDTGSALGAKSALTLIQQGQAPENLKVDDDLVFRGNAFTTLPNGLTAHGVQLYDNEQRRLIPVPAGRTTRAGVVDALVNAVRHQIAPVQTLQSGLASLEICLAILESSRTRQVVHLNHQIPKDNP
mgnify:CR=1 FL=1